MINQKSRISPVCDARLSEYDPACASLLIDDKIRQRLAATEQHHALVDLALADAALVWLAGATSRPCTCAGGEVASTAVSGSNIR